MAAAVTEITGTVCLADGTPFEGSQIRAKIRSTQDDQGGQIAGGSGITSDAVEAFTIADGTFSICLAENAVFLLEIPDINLSKEIAVPAGPGPVNFVTLI